MGKTSAIINAAFLPTIVFLGVLVAFVSPMSVHSLLLLSLGLSAISVLLLVVAKLPKLRHGDHWSFGVGGFAKHGPACIAAYVTLGTALFSWVFLYAKLVN